MYTIDDIKGIHPFLCIHDIFIEDNHKPSIEHPTRLNFNMKEVVNKEILQLIKVAIIYPISNSTWVSSALCLRKWGMTVMKNENNELIPTSSHGLARVHSL